MKVTTRVSRSSPSTVDGRGARSAARPAAPGDAVNAARHATRLFVTVLIVSGFGAVGLAIAGPAAITASTSALGAGSGVALTSHHVPVLSPGAPVTPEPVPAPSVSAELSPAPSVSGEPSPEPSPSVEPGAPSPTPAVEIPPGDQAPIDEGPQQRPATPPNVTVTQIPWTSILLAAGTLLLVAVAAVVLYWRARRSPVAEQDVFIAPDKPVGEDTAPTALTPRGSAQTLAAMVATGEAMIEGGYPVDRVQDALREIARVNGEDAAEVVVFPTAVLVSLRTGRTVETETVSVGRAPLLLFQLEALDTAVQEARKGGLAPKELLKRMREIRFLPPPFNFAQRFLASVMISIGLAMLLEASWVGVILAGVLGSFVGALMLLGSRIESRYQALLVVAAAFVVALVVFLFARTSIDPGILPALVAPLVILLPGGLLTTGVIELSTGEIMAGAARLAAGAMRLVLLAFGIVAAAALVGVPSIQLDSAAQPLGPLAPWIGVAAFGVGLAGVTSVLDGDATGISTLTTTLATMVAITLGLLVGLGLSSLLTRMFAGRAKATVPKPGE